VLSEYELVLEMLWWCAADGMAAPPAEISPLTFTAAARMLGGYFLIGAERVYGDAATTTVERNAATSSRWILRDRPDEVHVRHLQRQVRLPGLTTADAIHGAAGALVEADWLRAPAPSDAAGRPRSAYPVNPRLKEASR
jgi:hypothetical protein